MPTDGRRLCDAVPVARLAGVGTEPERRDCAAHLPQGVQVPRGHPPDGCALRHAARRGARVAPILRPLPHRHSRVRLIAPDCY